MKTAIIHIAGLNTPTGGDLCGLRAFWEPLAASLGASFTALAFDDPAARQAFATAVADADAVYASGHSHGADTLYKILQASVVPRVEVAAFLDDAPQDQPARWLGTPLPTPAVVRHGLWFFQRNDAPLAGVAGEPSATSEIYDVTAWGLHHTSMCADARVQDRIKMAVLGAHIERLREMNTAWVGANAPMTATEVK